MWSESKPDSRVRAIGHAARKGVPGAFPYPGGTSYPPGMRFASPFLRSPSRQPPLPGGQVMYRSILVPLDGSPFAEHALPLALSIARRARATVQIAHVDLVPSSMYVLSRPNMESTYDAQARERAAAYLDDLVWRLSARAPVPVETV